jgi:hypothetical protein
MTGRYGVAGTGAAGLVASVGDSSGSGAEVHAAATSANAKTGILIGNVQLKSED